MKKIIVKILNLSMMLVIAASILNICYATDGATLISKGNSFVGASSALNISEVIIKLQPIANIIITIAVIVFVGVGLVMGVKYMTQGPDEKAKMKERLIYYIIAMALTFGVLGIYEIIAAVYNAVIGNG